MPRLSVHVLFVLFRIGFAHIGRVGSVAVTVSISIERYLSIRHPNKTISIKSWLLPFPILFATLYNIPKFFEFSTCNVDIMHGESSSTKFIHQNVTEDMLNWPYSSRELDTTHVNEDNATLFVVKFQELIAESLLRGQHNQTMIPVLRSSTTRCSKQGFVTTNLRKNHWYIIFYVFLSELLLVEVIPWIIVITLNTRTFWALVRFQKNRKRFLRTHSPGTWNTHS